MEVVLDRFGGELRGDFMDPDANKSAKDLAKIRQEIVALRRRLKDSARRNRKLSSETELLLKKVEKAE